MTTDILLALALVAALILNAAQASQANVWRKKLKDAAYQIDLLTRPVEDDEAVHTYSPTDRGVAPSDTRTDKKRYDDWLEQHPGVAPKPGYERKRR